MCDPYGGNNLLQFIPTPPPAQSPDDKLPDNSVVLITTKLDHVSFYSQSGTGTLAQMILLAARRALGSAESVAALKAADRSIVLAYMAAEDLGNVGSSSLIYDFNKGQVPVYCEMDTPGCPMSSKVFGFFFLKIL